MTLLSIVKTSDCTPESFAEMKKMLMEQISINVDLRIALSAKQTDEQETIDGLRYQVREIEKKLNSQEIVFNDLRADLQKFCKLNEKVVVGPLAKHKEAVMEKLGEFILANGQKVEGINT